MNRLPDRPDSDISNLLAGYALDALEPAERDFIARNLPRRPEWRAELAVYQEVATALAHVPDERDVPLRIRASMLAEIAEIESDVPVNQTLPSSTHDFHRSSGDESKSHSGWQRRAPRIALATAMPAIIVAIVFAMYSVIMHNQMTNQQSELAEYAQSQGDTLNVLMSENRQPTVIDMSKSSEAPLARGRLFINPDEKSAVLVARNLPAIQGDQTYVAWVSDSRSPTEYARVGTIEVNESGAGQIGIGPPSNAMNRVYVFVTLEDDPEVDQPKGPEVLSGSL